MHNHPLLPCFRIGDRVRVQGDRATAKVRTIVVATDATPFFQGLDEDGVLREYENRQVLRVIPHDCAACNGGAA